jgi:predicted alpha/beta hydrolase
MTPTRLQLQAHDGHPLTAYCYDPAHRARANVVIGPAMAVPQSFYAAFATFLTGLGYRVWTFDYRGMGESRQGPMRDCQADLTDWIAGDFDAVVVHASQHPDALPLFVLGHSLGGQAVPLLPSVRHISAVVNIAVASGAIRHNQPRIRPLTRILWGVIAPLLCRVFGYFPGGRLGIVGDIPRGVMLQWRAWCLTPEYLLSAEPGARAAYARASYPVLGLAFSDDELLMEAGSRMLHDACTGADVDYRVLSPRQFNLPRIGHFGFFKPKHEKTLWPLVSDWLGQRCGVAAP